MSGISNKKDNDLLEHNSTFRYRKDIDGLRAVAILPVVAYHSFPQYAPGGFVGVDIFFVISGYLISLILFKKLIRNDFVITDFYSHRVRRIFPALLLVIGSCFAFGWFALLPDEFKQLGKHMAAGTGFVQNLVLWQEAGYFDVASEQKPLMHLWSLAIEEQFYLIYPLLLWATWKSRLNVLVVVVLMGAISFFLNLRGIHQDPVKTFFAPHTRVWELLAGSVLAYFQCFKSWSPRNHHSENPESFIQKFISIFPDKQGREANILSVIGLALIVCSIAVFDSSKPYPGIRAGVPVLGAVLLILAGPQAWINQKLLSNKAAVWVGLISYPLYLWHWPLLSFARIIESEMPSTEVRIAAVVLSFIFAAFTYYVIEKPIRYGLPNWRRKAQTLFVLSVVMGAVGYNIYARDGLSFRVKEVLAKNYVFSANNIPWLESNQDESCKAKFPKFANAYCRISSVDEPTIQIVGDSHALSLYPGMRDVVSDGESVLYIGAGGCLPLINVATLNYLILNEVDHKKNTCLNLMNPAIEAAAQSNARTIVFWFRGSMYLDSDVRLSLITHPEITDKNSIMRMALRDTLNYLTARDRKIIFVLDNPDLNFNPKSCIESRPLRLTKDLKEPCAIPRSSFDKRSKEFRDLANSVLKDFPSVKVFDAATQLCDQDWCWAIKDGKMLYLDSDHLSLEGARVMATEILKLSSEGG